MRLNNIRIRKKLVIIYVVCVILPLAATNYFILMSVKYSIEKEQIDEIENIVRRVEYSISESINQAAAISDYLYIDKKLNQFVSRKYENPIEYYAYFNQYDNVIQYYYSTRTVYNISIFADNDTIISGTNFWKLSDIEDKKWLRLFKDSGQQVYFCTYYGAEDEYKKHIGRARYLSLIRYMDYFGEGHILKLDLDYQVLWKNILNESGEADIYVYDEENILYSNRDTGNQNFRPVSDIRLKKIELTGFVNVLGKRWNISVTEDRYNLLAGIVESRTMIIILLVVNLMLPSLLIVLIDRSFRERIMLTEQHIRKMENGSYEAILCREGRDEIGNLIRSYNLMVLKIKELIETVYKKNAEKQELEISRKQAELNALQSQLNPHFIFNMLESIRMKSYLKGEYETAEITGKMAALIRVVIKWDKDFVTIGEELKHVKSYLEIQKYRLEERLHFSIHVQEECKEQKIPKFGILTFVENACVHGITKSIKGGSVTIHISKYGEQVYIEIMDNGNGMEEDELINLKNCINNASIKDLSSSKSIGILNTVVRLKLYYEGNMQIEINSKKNEGTEISVVLPLVYNENLENN